MRLMLMTFVVCAGAAISNAQLYTQCPATTFDHGPVITFSGCSSLITVNGNGSTTVANDPGQPTNQGVVGPQNVNDAVIGVQNNSGRPLTSITITGASTPDGGGTFAFDASGSVSLTVSCPVANPGVTGYEGTAGETFVNLTSTNVPCDGGTVNFSPAIQPGGSAYFFLERPVINGTISVTPGNPINATPVPAGSIGVLLGAAFIFVYGMRLRFARTS